MSPQTPLQQEEASSTAKNAPKKEQSQKRTARSKILSILVILVGLGVAGGGAWLYTQRYGTPSFLLNYFGTSGGEDQGPEEIEVCLGKDVLDTAVESIEAWAASEKLTGREVHVSLVDGTHSQSCDVEVSSSDDGYADLVYRNYYVVVGNKASKPESISTEELAVLLGQGSAEIGDNSYDVFIDEGALGPVDRVLGVGVSIEPSEDVISQIEKSGNALGVIPFEDLTNRIDVVPVDKVNLLTSEDVSEYILKEEVWLTDKEEYGLFSQLQEVIGSGNFDQDSIRTVVITGTSVVGARGHYQQSVATNDWMNAVRDVGDILRDADIAHISNEGSFVPGCVQNTWTMVFCGPEEAFELLTWAGIDVVGLTGNHILDFSENNFLATLDMYEDAEIEYFGGGRNYEDAHTAAVIDLGTVKVGFLGYNMIPPVSSFAVGDNPGSAELQVASIQKDIASIRDDVDFIFVDMQWGNEYVRQPNRYQIEYGHAAIDAGADIVSGVHPHWVEPVEYYKNGVIFYSLGNFIFDQLWSRETREGVMVRHIFYGDRYVGYELIPTLLSEELRVEIATGDDAERISGYVVGGLAE